MTASIQCIVVDDEPTAREILSIHLNKIPNIELVAVCKNALEAFQVISTQSIDLIFLDINMPQLSGLSFAKSIAKDKKIIFTTAHREFAVEGFELQAVDYLLKPISLQRLQQAINNYNSLYAISTLPTNRPHTQGTPSFTFVRSNRKMVKIVFAEIRYLESFGDYLKIHFREKYIVTRQTLSSIQGQLPTEYFKKIHRSFIINIYAVEAFTQEYVCIQQQTLPISRSYKKEVLSCLEAIK